MPCVVELPTRNVWRFFADTSILGLPFSHCVRPLCQIRRSGHPSATRACAYSATSDINESGRIAAGKPASAVSPTPPLNHTVAGGAASQTSLACDRDRQRWITTCFRQERTIVFQYVHAVSQTVSLSYTSFARRHRRNQSGFPPVPATVAVPNRRSDPSSQSHVPCHSNLAIASPMSPGQNNVIQRS